MELTNQCIFIFAHLVKGELTFAEWADEIACNYDTKNKKINACIKHLKSYPKCKININSGIVNIKYR